MPMTDNPALSPNPRPRRPVRHRDDAEVTAGIQRQIVALGRRLAEDDPGALVHLETLARTLADATERAVHGWRASGFSDADIGAVLGVTKQAVAQRWPRSNA